MLMKKDNKELSKRKTIKVSLREEEKNKETEREFSDFPSHLYNLILLL